MRCKRCSPQSSEFGDRVLSRWPSENRRSWFVLSPPAAHQSGALPSLRNPTVASNAKPFHPQRFRRDSSSSPDFRNPTRFAGSAISSYRTSCVLSQLPLHVMIESRFPAYGIAGRGLRNRRRGFRLSPGQMHDSNLHRGRSNRSKSRSEAAKRHLPTSKGTSSRGEIGYARTCGIGCSSKRLPSLLNPVSCQGPAGLGSDPGRLNPVPRSTPDRQRSQSQKRRATNSANDDWNRCQSSNEVPPRRVQGSTHFRICFAQV